MIESATAKGPAYLLAWEKLPDGAWGARIAWIEIDETAPDRTIHVTDHVAAGDITKLDGQEYSGVPRRGVTPPGD
ncbi:hypothetical protein ACFVH6_39365 [Spirillospora sp. NPDC127200]